MRYGVPEITDLGQIGEHVFANFSPNNENHEEPTVGAGPGGGTAGGTILATGSAGGGLAGLGLVGGLLATLAGRSSNQQVGSGEPAGDEPEADRANER